MSDDIEQFLRDQSAREQRLDDLLAASPVRTITGVIDALGVGGSQSRGQVDWTLIIPLAAWRLEGGLAHQSPFTLRQSVNQIQLEALRERLLPYRLVRVRARVALETELGVPQGAIQAFLEHDPKDAALKQLASDLQNPVIRHEAPFGELVLDRSIGWFRGKAAWNGSPIEVQLSIDETGSCDVSLRIARALWDDPASWEQRVMEKVEERLLQIKNDHWLDEGQSPVTAEQFRSLLSLESVTTNPDGTFEFWCNDGDLFWGHSISVAGDLTNGPTRATLEG
ncbi:MAG: DUF2262 domain-containing protein [Phycisphaeraceae bacterium]|nr:DUF2262 domain-containing protein [Phycisphaeraceae bacterium]